MIHGILCSGRLYKSDACTGCHCFVELTKYNSNLEVRTHIVMEGFRNDGWDLGRQGEECIPEDSV